MSRKEPTQNFEEFLGEDVTLSPLRTDPNSAIRMQNLEKMHNGSLRGRQGYKIASQMVCIRQISTYVYIDEDDVIQREIVGLGYIDDDYVTLFRLKKGTFTIGRTSAAWGVSILPDTSADTYRLRLVESSTQVASFNLGTGYESSPYTLKNLADDINAEANYTCSSPVTAVVNGNQTAKTITVDSGHTISAEDIVQVNPITSGTEIHQTSVLATTATTLIFTTDGNMTVADNDVIGHGNFPAAILDLKVLAEATDTSKTFSYWFWEQVPYLALEHGTALSRVGPFLTASNLRDQLGKTQPAFTNQRNCLYFTGVDVSAISMKQYIEFKEVGDLYAGVFKYDGKRVRMAGTPRDNATEMYLNPTTNGPSGTTTTAPLPAGVYYYRYSVTIVDAQDNEPEYFSNFEHVWTAGGTFDAYVQYFTPDLQLINSLAPRKWGMISTTLTAGTTASTTFTVTAGHRFRSGEYLYFKETGNTTVTKRKISSVTNTTIVIEGDAVTVANGQIVSNARLRLWRTPVGSKAYFLNQEFAWEVTDGVYAVKVIDTVTDANLGIILTALQPDKEQFPLPPSNTISNIQGLLVTGGGKYSGNQVNWEGPNMPEFSPQATNNYPLPAKSSGDIQAFIEGVFSGLMILKNKAQYKSGGSFSDSTVEINKEAENGYGANNPHGVTEADQVIVGVSSLGLWLNNQGQNTKNFGQNYYKYFRQCTYAEETEFHHVHSTIYYDSRKNWLHVFLPAYTFRSTTEEYYPNTSSKHLVYMIDSGCWAEFTYDNIQMYPSAGVAETNDHFFQAGYYYDSGWKGYMHKRLDGETTDMQYDFHDNASTFDYDLLTAWDDDGDPEHDKAWSELVVYSLQPDCFTNSFTIKLQSFRDWQETTAKKDTERLTSLVFSASTVTESKIQFDKGYKAKRRALRFYGTIDLNPPIISGYSYLLAPDQYGKGRLD